MNLFDPARPQINGQPAYLSNGRAVAPIPYIAVKPLAEGRVLLSVWLLTAPNNAGYHWATVSRGHLCAILEDWTLDPEQVMETMFKWPGYAHPQPAPRARPTAGRLSLADLGL